jgi:transposase InsO family protein
MADHLRTSGLLPSTGGVGSACQDAMAESFFATRRHSRLDNLSPAAYQQLAHGASDTERGVRLTGSLRWWMAPLRWAVG